jgi:hypothetical protein
MMNVHIVVEGQTEQTFVRNILKPHFAARQIFLKSVLVTTSRDNRTGRTTHGGMQKYTKPKGDIQRLLNNRNDFVTTMFDFYALPRAFPGYEEALRLRNIYDKVSHLEESFANDINHQHFIPYIQLHEFEAFLFTDTETTCQLCDLNSDARTNLQRIRREFETPEHINDNPQTAPSKRILSVHPSYEKIADGVRIAETIGLDNLRRECLHFNAWLEKLESLSSS